MAENEATDPIKKLEFLTPMCECGTSLRLVKTKRRRTVKCPDCGRIILADTEYALVSAQRDLRVVCPPRGLGSRPV